MSDIYQALGAIQRDLGPVLKTRIDAGRNRSYQAFSVDDVYRALHPLFAEHGVILAPQVPDVEYVERDRINDSGVTYGVAIDARVTGRYILYAEDGTSIEIGFRTEARDTGDKATIQASQQALKYALIQMFLIAAGDPSAEPPPEPAGKPTAEQWLNKAKTYVYGLAGKDKDEAEQAWPLVLEKAKLEGVVSEKDYDKVVFAADRLLTTDDD